MAEEIDISEIESKYSRKKQNFTIAAISLTAIYVFFVITYLYVNKHNPFVLDANLFGDFVAGISAPLAVIWFVFAYLLQGTDLSLNVEILKIQTKELNIQAKALQGQEKAISENTAHTRRDILLKIRDEFTSRLASNIKLIYVKWHGTSVADQRWNDFASGDQDGMFRDLAIAIDRDWTGMRSAMHNWMDRFPEIVVAVSCYVTEYEDFLGKIESYDQEDLVLSNIKFG